MRELSASECEVIGGGGIGDGGPTTFADPPNSQNGPVNLGANFGRDTLIAGGALLTFGANGGGAIISGLSIPATDGADAPLAAPLTIAAGARAGGSLIGFGVASANAVDDLYGAYLQRLGYLDAYGNPYYDNY